MGGSGKTWTVGLAGGNGTRLRECAFGQMGYKFLRSGIGGVIRNFTRLNSHEIFFDPRRSLQRRRTPSDCMRESYDSKRCQKLNECARIGKAFRKLAERYDDDRQSLRVIGLLCRTSRRRTYPCPRLLVSAK
jgi:hypothetical protein